MARAGSLGHQERKRESCGVRGRFTTQHHPPWVILLGPPNTEGGSLLTLTQGTCKFLWNSFERHQENWAPALPQTCCVSSGQLLPVSGSWWKNHDPSCFTDPYLIHHELCHLEPIRVQLDPEGAPRVVILPKETPIPRGGPAGKPGTRVRKEKHWSMGTQLKRAPNFSNKETYYFNTVFWKVKINAKKKSRLRLGIVAHGYNPSYSVGRDWEDLSSRLANETPISKNKLGMVVCANDPR
jgi:hypothetical protein